MRIIYWNTSCLQPEIEAVSKEIFQLARHFRKNIIFGISPHYKFRLSVNKGYIGFNTKFDPLLRILIPLLEQYSDINHVYGEGCPWIFYKTLKRKPLLLTIASEKGLYRFDFLSRCQKIIVQTKTLKKKLLDFGIEKKKVELIYPGVNFFRFRPSANPLIFEGGPRVLFATAPRSMLEMNKRGVNLLLEAAKESPEIRYHLLFRKWRTGYTSLEETKKIISNQDLRNVTLTNSNINNMADIYNQHHFVVIPYVSFDGGKECPNSLVEGLACGLPVLISSVSPFAYFVENQKCGIIFDPKPASLISAIEFGIGKYRELSKNAVKTAIKYFSEKLLIKKMEKIYYDMYLTSSINKKK